MINSVHKIQLKKEPLDDNGFGGLSVAAPNSPKFPDKIVVKTELRPSPNSTEYDPFVSSNMSVVGSVGLSDILELSEKELAKRIYQAETGIKYLYFVLIPKTEQMRYLAKARKLKHLFVTLKATNRETAGEGAIQLKKEPLDDNGFGGLSVAAPNSPNLTECGPFVSSNMSVVGSVGLSDILELSEKELAKRIYQAETGIKYLYFVLIPKTEQMRYLAKARKLKHLFVTQKPTNRETAGEVSGRRKSLTNFDPSCADYRSLHRILMSDEQRAELYRKRNQRQRERRQQMTEDELAEERAKARKKAVEKRARMNAAQLEAARRKHAERRRKRREAKQVAVQGKG